MGCRPLYSISMQFRAYFFAKAKFPCPGSLAALATLCRLPLSVAGVFLASCWTAHSNLGRNLGNGAHYRRGYTMDGECTVKSDPPQLVT